MRQTRDDLNRHLDEGLSFIRRSAHAFDEGCVGEARRLAVSIRVLVHDTARSTSLLQQLGLKSSLSYYSTPIELWPTNLLTGCSLVLIRATNATLEYRPFLDDFPPVAPWCRLSFEDWWGQIVLRDREGRTMSRSKLVLAVANRDGGAHVDPRLDQAYAELSRDNALNWFLVTSEEERIPGDGPHLACVRQIAHELEKTLLEHREAPGSR